MKLHWQPQASLLASRLSEKWPLPLGVERCGSVSGLSVDMFWLQLVSRFYINLCDETPLTVTRIAVSLTLKEKWPLGEFHDAKKHSTAIRMTSSFY